MRKNTSKDSEYLGIEKQKTIRLVIIVFATLLLGSAGIYVVYQGTMGGGKGTLTVEPGKGKISLSLEKPIVNQINIGTSTASAQGNDIQFTEGKVADPTVINQLQSLSPSQPTQFSGKNFINHSLGFFLTVLHPENWQVMYNPAGLQNPAIPVNTIYNQEGSHLNIGVGPITPGIDIQMFVTQNIQQMIQSGVIQQMPTVSYDFPSQTAFAIFTNPMTKGQSYQKVIIDRARNRVFVTSANYNQALSSPETIQDLINMIASFTLF